MIDFTNKKRTNKFYNGVNGSKICVVYNEELYMIKFPSKAKLNQELSYANSCVSEYLGSHIFNSIGISAQETLLGTFKVNGITKLVVACKDFATNENTIQDFGSLKNQILDSDTQGQGTELNSIMETIMKQTVIDKSELNDFFWDTFIVDTLIGNWDRHNGNWGFLYNTKQDSVKLAPIWDCGSSLYPQADDKMMKSVLTDKNELNQRVFVKPTSAITINGSRINYFDFISSCSCEDCNKALKRIVPKIKLEEINSLIANIDCITDLQKEFYQTMLKERKIMILDKSLEILLKKEKAISIPKTQGGIAGAKQRATAKLKEKQASHKEVTHDIHKNEVDR